jgi:hypothetical protein
VGYRRADLWDARQRYLPPVTGDAEQPEQREQAIMGAVSSATAGEGDDPDVPQAGAKANGCDGAIAGNVPDVPFPRTPKRDDTERDRISFGRSCPDCGGKGCSTCGEYKREDGAEL